MWRAWNICARASELKLRHSTEEELHLQWVSFDELTIRTAIRKGRSDDTPLLLLNGIGASLEMLFPFVDASSGRDVVLLDVPGAGKSTPPARPWRLQDYCRVVARTLDHLAIDLVNVMGVSWGGALAQQFARQYPCRCDNLILASTSYGQFSIPGRASALVHMLNPRRYLDKGYMLQIAGTLYGGKLRTNRLAAGNFADMMRGTSKRGYYYQLLALGCWSSLTWLHRIQHNTLVLHGEDDPIVPLANARILARLIPNSGLETFDCGHLFMLTRARRVSICVDGFFSAA